jgi:hypothetical protein
MDVLIVIGDQDTYHEAEYDIVSSPKLLADIMTEEGVRGLFALHARRAEILVEQGRHDVIQAMRHHEIGLHGRDIHPVVPEIVEGLGWDDGIAALREVEGADLELLGRVFDVAPVCSSMHRDYGAPQLFGLARQLKIPFLFGFPTAPPRYSLSWFAGALNVPFSSPVPEFLGFFGTFDDYLNDDALYAELFGRMRRHIARCQEVGLPLLVVFICHPERLCYTGPIELWLYGNGKNHGRGAVPPGVEIRRSRTEIERALVNFRTLVRYLRDTPGLQLTTVTEMVRNYGTQVATISREELTDLATRALAERKILIGSAVSAAETVLGFAESLVAQDQAGRLPETVPRRDVLGPMDSPPLAPEVPRLDRPDLLSLARQLVASKEEMGYLPAALTIRGRSIGLPSLYGALAEAYLAAAATDASADRTSFMVSVWPRYPELAQAFAERQRRCVADPLVRPGLSTDALTMLTCLQSWTLKPAHRT